MLQSEKKERKEGTPSVSDAVLRACPLTPAPGLSPAAGKRPHSPWWFGSAWSMEASLVTADLQQVLSSEPIASTASVQWSWWSVSPFHEIFDKRGCTLFAQIVCEMADA